jgi:hypothetical protein
MADPKVREATDKMELARDLIYQAREMLPSPVHNDAKRELQSIAEDLAKVLSDVLSWKCRSC